MNPREGRYNHTSRVPPFLLQKGTFPLQNNILKNHVSNNMYFDSYSGFSPFQLHLLSL